MKKFDVTIYTEGKIISDRVLAETIHNALEALIVNKKVNSEQIKSCLVAPLRQ